MKSDSNQTVTGLKVVPRSRNHSPGEPVKKWHIMVLLLSLALLGILMYAFLVIFNHNL